MEQSASDEVLMGRVAAGDAAALQLLVERHLPRAHAIASRVLAGEADAQDAVQEAFTKVWMNAARWRPQRAAFTTWLYRIVVNSCLDMARRKAPDADSDAIIAALPDGGDAAETRLETDEQAARVRTAVQALPEHQRMAVTLCYFEAFTNPEAAQIMDMNVKALEGLLVRARRQLRQALIDT
jgi:RNA polymerase sigma-70 factor (ECF subfamily)